MMSNDREPTAYRTPLDGDDQVPRASGTRATQFGAGELVAGRYRLIRKLGQGGMGVVWVAHSLALGVEVAIKLIRTGAADSDPDLASRMAREAQATATLGHPALVRVFDFGTTPHGDPFLVMELAHGETLAALLNREKKLPPVQALQLLLPLLDGLRCAHEHGIVHRDIKPENVFIARDALGRVQPKLLDFGIAKLKQQPDVSRLTQVGEVLGSPEFMSPEQARGSSDIDARTDIWSSCVMLYEMLTGTLPFKVGNYNALMQAILHEQPVPTVEHGAGDRDLWLALAKGLEKTRDKRWSSMTALGEALAFWLYDHGITEDIAGNSVKALWLGGTLTGLSSEARAEVIAPTELVTGRQMVTVRLKFRRFRHRVRRALTPAVLTVVGAALLVALGLFSWGAVQPKANGGPVVQASALPAAPVSTTVAARTATEPGAVAADGASPAPSASPTAEDTSKRSKKTRGQPASTRRAAPRDGAKGAATKSIRDFGF